MRVTILSKEFPPNIYGGVGIHLKYLTAELKKKCKIEVRTWGKGESNGKIKVKRYLPPKNNKISETVHWNGQLVEERIDSDIVHCHTWYTAYAGYVAKRLYKKKLIITAHSLEPSRPWKAEQLGKTGYEMSTMLERMGYEAADMVIAVSKEMKRDVSRFYGVKRSRIVVIPNGIDLEKYKAETKPGDYVLFVGRLSKQKGIMTLVDAAKDVKGKIVLLTGKADTKELELELKEKLKKLNNVKWINKMVSEEQLIDYYSKAAVFCCPSIYEPFGIINLEAMALKKPVVASAVGGIKDVVTKKTGILVKPNNPKRLAKALNYLLDNPEAAQRMGEEGRKRAEEHYSWKNVAEQTLRAYRKCLQ